MMALLGMSAWHLWALDPDDQTMAWISRSYFGKAISLQRTALAEYKKWHGHDESVAALFIAGLMLAHHSWLLALTGESEGAFSINMDTYHLCSGFRMLGEEGAFPWASSLISGRVDIGYEQPLSPARAEFMRLAVSDGEQILACVANIDDDDKTVYQKGIEVLLEICYLVARDVEDLSIVEHSIVTFLHRVPHRFVAMLEQYDPVALAIHARIIAMLYLLNDSSSWWIHGAGKFRADRYAVMGTRHILPPEWTWITDWPLMIISDQVKLH